MYQRVGFFCVGVCVCVGCVSGDFPNKMGRVKSVRLFPGMGECGLKMHTYVHMCAQSHAVISSPLLLVPSYFHMQMNSLHSQPCEFSLQWPLARGLH